MDKKTLRVAIRYYQKIAAIQHPPRDLKKYLRNFADRVRGHAKVLVSLVNALTKEGEEDRDDFLSYATNRAIDGNDPKYALESFKELQKRVEDHAKDAEYIVKLIEEGDSYHAREQIKFVVKFIEYTLDQPYVGSRFLRDILENEVQIREHWKDEGEYYKGLSRHFITNLFATPQEMKLLRDRLNDALVKLRELLKMSAPAQFGGEKYVPEREDVETLYHASVDARQLYSRGFSEKPPQGASLGGANRDKAGRYAISFTSDLYIAKEIMRTLKEAVMIANGQVKAHQVLDWAQRAGVLDDVEDHIRGTYGQLDHKKTESVMLIYRAYITFAESKGKRYNPLFFGDMGDLMRRFKGKNARNVGVLACSVNMTDPNIDYLPAMHEYRVAPGNVISIDKLIT